MSKLFSVLRDKVLFFINFNLDEQTFKNYDYLLDIIKEYNTPINILSRQLILVKISYISIGIYHFNLVKYELQYCISCYPFIDTWRTPALTISDMGF